MATQKIRIFKQSAADKLRALVAKGDIEAYAEENPNWSAVLGGGFWRETSIGVVGREIAAQIQMPQGTIAANDNSGDGDDDKKADDKKRDIANSVIVYRALGNLTPQQAADERLWLHLTHCELWDYARARWPLPDEKEKRQAQIQLHYLVPKNRGLIRNNAIARLWWMGFVAERCRFDKTMDQKKALRILLHKSDVRANLLERPSLAASEEIFNGVMKMLSESYDGKQELFERDKFRTIMKMLNRSGGRRMLNVLGTDEVYKLGKKFAGDIPE